MLWESKSKFLSVRDLLENKKMNVTEAAFEVGYAHQQSFTKAFKNHFGTNPVDHIRQAVTEY
ncbi:helix-turn-helix domain-containing protein [uncultured Desulfobacter sp.]|uniref:helix-turn-helix domain-containing protein n=1 Tax=uncultured Desulfobacter sp. TaxID=240139 RepID=UPI0029F55004|nr:helix-turn-helix domain-containing protein [uncultured Desulfobacter sp.]